MRTPRAHVYRPRPRWHPRVGQLVEAYAHGRVVAVGYVESVASCRVRLTGGIGWTKIDYDCAERLRPVTREGRRLMRGRP